jgi:hypothetical protein
MDQDNEMTLTFRCPPELVSILPQPSPAVLGLPSWFKAMPQEAFNSTAQKETHTLKKCPPFIDAMTYGFLMPLMCDVTVKDGQFSWDTEFPPGGSSNFVRSPIGFHDPGQVTGSPLFDEDMFVIKFHNLWTIEAPPGYSLLFTHPVNRYDLPFTTLTGLVDSDRYFDNWVHFPARWHDAGFNGVLPKGTPIAQCMPVKRETWASQFATLSDQDNARIKDMKTALSKNTNLYREQYRAAKR